MKQANDASTPMLDLVYILPVVFAFALTMVKKDSRIIVCSRWLVTSRAFFDIHDLLIRTENHENINIYVLG
jgi:hypothetical protein